MPLVNSDLLYYSSQRGDFLITKENHSCEIFTTENVCMMTQRGRGKERRYLRKEAHQTSETLLKYGTSTVRNTGFLKKAHKYDLVLTCGLEQNA